MILVEEHVRFIEKIFEADERKSMEYLMMSHLKTSALYWSLTAAQLLQSKPAESSSSILEYLQRVYKADGGFAGNEGPHDSHLLFTLSAIQIFTILLGRGEFPVWFDLNRTINFILKLQLPNGSFTGDRFGESDTRFIYCALASLSLINRLDALTRREEVISYINSCKNFDGGYGAIPGSESHGGNIFCCISSLQILSTLPDASSSSELIEWLVWRQLPAGGLNGRPEKLPDVCYSWWILSALKTLSAIHRIDSPKLREFILNCQDRGHGGFADRPGDCGDIFHTLFGLAGLSFLQHEQCKVDINPVHCLPEHSL